MNGGEDAIVGHHRHLYPLHMLREKGDVAQRVVFPFAGTADDDNLFFSLLHAEQHRLVEIIGLLIITRVDDVRITLPVLFRDGVTVAYDGIRPPAAGDKIIGRPVGADNVGCFLNHGERDGMLRKAPVGDNHCCCTVRCIHCFIV